MEITASWPVDTFVATMGGVQRTHTFAAAVIFCVCVYFSAQHAAAAAILLVRNDDLYISLPHGMLLLLLLL